MRRQAARARRLLATVCSVFFSLWLPLGAVLDKAVAAPGGSDAKPQNKPPASLRGGQPARTLAAPLTTGATRATRTTPAKQPRVPEPRPLNRVGGAPRPVPRPITALPASGPQRPERPPSVARPSVESRIAAARDAYQAGRYAEVPTALVKLLSESPLSPPQLAAVYELLASAYVALGQTELAIRCFSEVLNRRPAFALDPVRTSPKIRAALDKAKDQTRDQARSPGVSQPATTPAAHKPL